MLPPPIINYSVPVAARTAPAFVAPAPGRPLDSAVISSTPAPTRGMDAVAQEPAPAPVARDTDPVVAAKPSQASHPADKYYSEQPLGAIYSPESTTFRVFAPTADALKLNLYPCPVGGEKRALDLKRNADGTWEGKVEGDLKNSYYTYSAAGPDPGFHPERELPDPYGECVTACDGRTVIVSDHTPIAPRPNFPAQDAIIYEMHLRDFTADPDSGVQQRGKYLGLTETGTRLTAHPEIKTGLDHLTELGVNTVQIMPFNEFASDELHDKYGWGYDAALYNTPDGWYATERLDGSRVKETKQMVDSLHKRGIRVVMDMVLNHTDDGLRKRAGAFEGLVPGYYYRRRPDGSNFDGSGCGNEIRSEAPMVRRFIKDSVKHWVKNYQIDGFRFDLMGLMDKQTMTELTKELHSVDPNLLIYGEPWAAGETPIEVTGKGSQKGLGFGVFNDNFRDSLKGSVFRPEEQGYIQNGGKVDAIRKGIAGSIDDFAAAPVETINYVECHDNHTLWDRLVNSTKSDSSVSDADRKAMDKLAAAVLLTSQGIPFFQSGQEMLRTKHGDDNSYDKPDSVNMIRWNQKLQNKDVVDYYGGLVSLRKAHPMFHLATADEVRKSLKFLSNLPNGAIGYSLTDPTGKDSWGRSTVLFNPSASAIQVQIPAGQWQLFVDGSKAGNSPIAGSAATLSGTTVKVPPRTAVVLGEKRSNLNESNEGN
jgi:pullulanase